MYCLHLTYIQIANFRSKNAIGFNIRVNLTILNIKGNHIIRNNNQTNK